MYTYTYILYTEDVYNHIYIIICIYHIPFTMILCPIYYKAPHEKKKNISSILFFPACRQKCQGMAHLLRAFGASRIGRGQLQGRHTATAVAQDVSGVLRWCVKKLSFGGFVFLLHEPGKKEVFLQGMDRKSSTVNLYHTWIIEWNMK